jgi:hypothetical protein
MAKENALIELLSQLDGIANALLTGPQREARAKPLLDTFDVTVPELAKNLGRLDLEWNHRKAEEYDVSPQTWLHAVKAVGVPAAETLGDLLYRLHQAESAVRIMRAGYSPAEGESGELRWSREEGDPGGDDSGR